jgi:hypothetical protein
VLGGFFAIHRIACACPSAPAPGRANDTHDLAQRWPTPSANSVDQTYAPALTLLNLLQLKPTTKLRRRKERPPFTGNQRIDDKPEFIHQPGIQKAYRRSSTPNEINVLSGLLLEGSDFVDPA